MTRTDCGHSVCFLEKEKGDGKRRRRRTRTVASLELFELIYFLAFLSVPNKVISSGLMKRGGGGSCCQ